MFSASKPDVESAADRFVEGMDQLQDEVENEYDAFLLDPGMGPMTYLTSDGRVLLDMRSWDGEPMHEATEDEEDQLEEAPGLTIQSRLSCQCVPDGTMDLIVEIPSWNRNVVKEAPHE